MANGVGVYHEGELRDGALVRKPFKIPTSAAKAELKNKAFIAAVNRCATQKHSRLVLWPAKPTRQPGDGFQGIAFQVSLQ